MKVTELVRHLLKQGRKRRELIELGFPKSILTREYRRLRKDKTALRQQKPDRAPEAETQLPTRPESPETVATIRQKVQSMATELQRMDSLIQALSEASIVISAARKLGTYRRQDCPYHKNGLCRLWTWDSQDEIPQGIGEPVQVDDENPGWYVKPSPIYCAMCAVPLEDHIDDLEHKLFGDPLSGAKYQFTCDGCGSEGWIAVKIMCTKCRRETYLGWWPKKE